MTDPACKSTGWQPIETAPKDGRGVLVYGMECYGVVVWCGCQRKWFLVEQGYNQPDKDTPIDWSAGLTHWMPLPPPPEDVHG